MNRLPQLQRPRLRPEQQLCVSLAISFLASTRTIYWNACAVFVPTSWRGIIGVPRLLITLLRSSFDNAKRDSLVSRQSLSLTFALLTRGERHLLWYSANIRFLPFYISPLGRRSLVSRRRSTAQLPPPS